MAKVGESFTMSLIDLNVSSKKDKNNNSTDEKGSKQEILHAKKTLKHLLTTTVKATMNKSKCARKMRLWQTKT